jgi:hypothetical protein
MRNSEVVTSIVPQPDTATLRSWCERHLDAVPETEVFRSGHLSAVIGLELSDGQEVVVKVRPYRHRLLGCFEVQEHLFDAGFPCPEPLLGPTPFGNWCASVEQLVVAGSATPESGRDPRPFANALAQVIALSKALLGQVDLEPKPSWNQWDHMELGQWPVAEDSERLLNEVTGADWLDRSAATARECLSGGSGPMAIGHGDWYWENLRFKGDKLAIAYDWDSVIRDRESIIVGFAASDYLEPSIEESAAFMAAYQDASGRQFTSAEMRQSWAAGLWLRSFNAQKQIAKGEVLDALSPDDAERLLKTSDCLGWLSAEIRGSVLARVATLAIGQAAIVVP